MPARVREPRQLGDMGDRGPAHLVADAEVVAHLGQQAGEPGLETMRDGSVLGHRQPGCGWALPLWTKPPGRATCRIYDHWRMAVAAPIRTAKGKFEVSCG